MPMSVQSGGSVVEAPHVVGETGEPAFTSPWVNADANNPTSFWKDGDRVHLQGRPANTAGTFTTEIFTLPVGYRPSGDVKFATTSDGVLAEILVQTDGKVRHVVGPSTNPSLDGLVFRVP